MRVTVQTFWLPKDGNTLDEYEDAFRPLDDAPGEKSVFRTAVADGATEASFSGLWADLLTRAYCRGRLSTAALTESLVRPARTWARRVGKKPLPWYAEQKRELGSFAALVGLEIRGEPRAWNAVAVGDCCLFHTRGDVILARFPLDSAELFNSRPLLLSTAARNNAAAIDSAATLSGVWEPGDTFYLMTDAMAAWFLRHADLPGTAAVPYIRSLLNQADFAEFVTLQRADRLEDGTAMMRNDDVTLLACTVM